jgi:hypothetical protein
MEESQSSLLVQVGDHIRQVALTRWLLPQELLILLLEQRNLGLPVYGAPINNPIGNGGINLCLLFFYASPLNMNVRSVSSAGQFYIYSCRTSEKAVAFKQDGVAWVM